MDVSRANAHRPFSNTIDEGSFGAASLCTPHANSSNDIDLGDYLTYTSAECHVADPMNHPLVLSCHNQVPVRLIRGYNLANSFAPKTGYRYDGLYLVISYWFVETQSSGKTLRFALARLDHQEPPAWHSSSSASAASTPSTGAVYNGTKTRNKSKTNQGCHMNCCQSGESPKSSNLPSKDKKEGKPHSISLTKSTVIPQMPLDKQSKESSIVMRHVSKKCEATPGIESPRLNHSPKSTCKLQNTNISIRTDLYDSSPNPHDVKKTPMTFCRVYKSSKPQVKSTPSTRVLNLNTFGPGARDKSQESQIQMRSGFKAGSPEMKSSEECASADEKDGEKREKPGGSRQSESVPSPAGCQSRRDSQPSVDSSADLTLKKQKMQSCQVSVESMTPGEMVELIVQQRHRTAGKMLIGQIIEDPTLLTAKPQETDGSGANSKVRDSKITNSKITDTTPKSTKRIKTTRVKTLYSLRSSSDGKKIGEGKSMIKRSVNNPKPVKSNPKNSKTLKTLKTPKSPSKAFSKSSKKRQSELAKLAIDANFVTKTRGPRTRTLPYGIRGFSKRRDNLRHLKGRVKPDLSKKTKLLKRNTKTEAKSSRIPQKLSMSIKSSEDIEPSKSKSKSKLMSGDQLLEKLEKGTQKRMTRKSKMVDAGVQCSLQKDASTWVNLDVSGHRGRPVQGKGSLRGVKSEREADNSDDLEEIVYRDSSAQTQAVQGIFRPNFGRFAGRNSAFVPVNVSDGDFRVARLRAIGFKPIDPCSQESIAFSQFTQGSKGSGSKATVARRDVDEQFNKYTTEENNVVGYMDDDLRYQDIEEESVAAKTTAKVSNGKERKPRILRGKRKGEDSWHEWKKFAL